MAKNKDRKDLNPWERFIRWTEANQKVIWVVLLALISFTFAFPVQSVFERSQMAEVHSVVFGQPITFGQRNRLAEAYGSVISDLQRMRAFLTPSFSFGGARPELLPGPLASPEVSFLGMGGSQPTVDDLILLREEAERMGFRVSEEELGRYVKELWWGKQAVASAIEEVTRKSPNLDSSQSFQVMQQIQQAAEPIYAKLKDGNYFDAGRWQELVEVPGVPGRRRGFTVGDYESALADLCAIAKLEAYVRSAVQVSPRDVFEEFQKLDQKRRFSWVEFPVPDELKAKFLAKVTDEQVRQQHEAELKRQTSRMLKLRASWLLLPTEHFEKQAQDEATEDALLAHYKEHREQYRRPTILAEDAQFALRTGPEQAAYEERRYVPFEECRDRVKEDYVAKRAGTLTAELAASLQPRLFPPSPGAAAPAQPGATFADLVKEHPYLETGTTEFVTQYPADELKEAFGKGFSSTVESWFRTAATRDVTAPRVAVEAAAGRVFYKDVEVRKPNEPPPVAELEPKIRERLAATDALRAIESAAASAWEAARTAGKDLAAFAAEGIEVEVDGARVKVPALPVASTDRFIGMRDSVLVPSAEPPKDAAATEDPDTLLEPFKASERLVHTAFLAKGEAGETSTGHSLQEGAELMPANLKVQCAFLVRIEAVRLPDPARFKDRESMVESDLLREKRDKYFGDWLATLAREARTGGPAAVPATGEGGAGGDAGQEQAS